MLIIIALNYNLKKIPFGFVSIPEWKVNIDENVHYDGDTIGY